MNDDDDNGARLQALRELVAADPDNSDLALGLARLLISRGHREESLAVIGRALAATPRDDRLIRFIAELPAQGATAATAPAPEAVESPRAPERARSDDATESFSWDAAEADVDGVIPPSFVESGPSDYFDERLETVTLSDVAGLASVKEKLSAAFFAPLANPELRRLYGKSLRGGLLLYGPPGCGKTFLARAVAGELGARFLSIALTDVLDPYLGASERNLHRAFEEARRSAPCVLFLDEVDALGQRRSHTRNTAMRGVVNQLLTELDGVTDSNDGVFVLAASNQPWDIDPALRRPGRLGRTVLVVPPDLDARKAIFEANLIGRPVESIDLDVLGRKTDGFTGADISAICESAAEQALIAALRTNEMRLIGMPNLLEAIADSRPSSLEWAESVRNLVTYGSDDGTFGELRAYLKTRGRR